MIVISKKTKTNIDLNSKKVIEKFINEIEINILNFSLNKCIASIYTLFNNLEKNSVHLSDDDLSKKILICLFPIIPKCASLIYFNLFNQEIRQCNWPTIDLNLLEESEIKIPIQIHGKLVTTIETKKDYNEEELLNEIYTLEKIKKKIEGKKIFKVINVQNKIINIITN